MVVAPTQWLLRLMVLVMAFTGPMQAFASLLQGGIAVCPAAGHSQSQSQSQSLDSGAHQQADMGADHCDHQTEHPSAAAGGGSHDQCAATCLGTCGACAHCPASVPQFSSAVEVPQHHLIPTGQRRPGDVPPDTNLRPPRAFS